jgi:hypothetical protein
MEHCDDAASRGVHVAICGAGTLGNGDGTFQASLVVTSTLALGMLRSADFNQDGKLDLVALSNGAIILFLGNGDGTFQPPVTLTANAVYFSGLAVADMNRDGKPDIIALSTNSNGYVAVMLGNGDGTFQQAISNPLYSAGNEVLVVGDFNGDGKPDVAVVNWVNVAVQLGNGDGTLQSTI